MPFISDKDLGAALTDAGVTESTAAAIVEENEESRRDGLRAALSVLALIALTRRSCPTAFQHASRTPGPDLGPTAGPTAREGRPVRGSADGWAAVVTVRT